MAYPFAPCPTFAQFKARLEAEFHCQYKTLERCLRDPHGNTHSVHYFEREASPEDVRHAVVEINREDIIVVYSVIRSICSKLGIDHSVFGLTLG